MKRWIKNQAHFIKSVVPNHNNGYDPHSKTTSSRIFHCFCRFFFLFFFFWLSLIEKPRPIILLSTSIQYSSFEYQFILCSLRLASIFGYSINSQSTIDNLLPTYSSTMNIIKPHNSSFSGLNNMDKWLRSLQRSLLLFVKYQVSLICSKIERDWILKWMDLYYNMMGNSMK